VEAVGGVPSPTFEPEMQGCPTNLSVVTGAGGGDGGCGGGGAGGGDGAVVFGVFVVFADGSLEAGAGVGPRVGTVTARAAGRFS
jgi:hypothetical protein